MASPSTGVLSGRFRPTTQDDPGVHDLRRPLSYSMRQALRCIGVLALMLRAAFVGAAPTTEPAQVSIPWVRTTPAPPSGTNSEQYSPAQCDRLNRAAYEVMQAQHVAEVDPYRQVEPKLADLELADNVHFKEAGYQLGARKWPGRSSPPPAGARHRRQTRRPGSDRSDRNNRRAEGSTVGESASLPAGIRPCGGSTERLKDLQDREPRAADYAVRGAAFGDEARRARPDVGRHEQRILREPGRQIPLAPPAGAARPAGIGVDVHSPHHFAGADPPASEIRPGQAVTALARPHPRNSGTGGRTRGRTRGGRRGAGGAAGEDRAKGRATAGRDHFRQPTRGRRREPSLPAPAETR